MKQDFEIIIDEQIFTFELDKHGTVWLKDQNGSGSNHGQTRPAKDINEAKEIARIMLYAMGKTKTI